jgi:hypothetical protein
MLAVVPAPYPFFSRRPPLDYSHPYYVETREYPLSHEKQYSAGPSGGPGDSESLKACQSLLNEFLPKLKALPGAQVTRQVCGGCMDFKVSITQPLEEHGAWAGANYDPLESEFMGKLKAIDGTSLHETQEITFEAL